MSYHPLYDGLWHHEDLEGAPFEEKAFFIFLWSNARMRPSGIYRVTDEQLAADAELPMKRVQGYLTDLVRRRRIVRDRAWLFVRGYFARQPKQERLLLGVQADISACSSGGILLAFGEKYPMYSKWSADRLEKVSNPQHEKRSPDTDAVTEQLQIQIQSSNTSPRAEEATWPSPEALVKLYNATAPDECPEVTRLSPGRRKKAAAYLSMFPDRTFWEETCAQIRASRFLRGLRPRPGHDTFIADFDWLLTKGQDGSENCVKVYEGKYHD